MCTYRLGLEKVFVELNPLVDKHNLLHFDNDKFNSKVIQTNRLIVQASKSSEKCLSEEEKITFQKHISVSL